MRTLWKKADRAFHESFFTFNLTKKEIWLRAMCCSAAAACAISIRYQSRPDLSTRTIPKLRLRFRFCLYRIDKTTPSLLVVDGSCALTQFPHILYPVAHTRNEKWIPLSSSWHCIAPFVFWHIQFQWTKTSWVQRSSFGWYDSLIYISFRLAAFLHFGQSRRKLHSICFYWRKIIETQCECCTQDAELDGQKGEKNRK